MPLPMVVGGFKATVLDIRSKDYFGLGSLPGFEFQEVSLEALFKKLFNQI